MQAEGGEEFLELRPEERVGDDQREREPGERDPAAEIAHDARHVAVGLRFDRPVAADAGGKDLLGIAGQRVEPADEPDLPGPPRRTRIDRIVKKRRACARPPPVVFGAGNGLPAINSARL